MRHTFLFRNNDPRYAVQRKSRATWCPRAAGQRRVRLVKIVGPLVAVALLLLIFGVAVVGGVLDANAAQLPAPVCASTGSVTGLSDPQAQNARTVVAVAEGRAGDRAALIALMVGLAESQLLVLSNPNVAAGQGLPSQGVGSDHDSLGIFQQRAGWGSAAQRMDPVVSTNLFLTALTASPTWRSQDPWAAAQTTQRSAFDGHPNAANHFSSVYGGNYLAQLDRATTILREIAASASTAACGASVAEPPSGATDAFGLPLAYRIPASSSLSAQSAIALALAQRGKPYVWGAVGPDSYDCSGLMVRAWSSAGIQLHRTTQQQLSDGTASSIPSIAPGDLVLIPGSDGSLAAPGHVGMYIGNGLVVHAPHTGDVVRVVTLTSFVADGVSAIRHIG